MTPQAKAMQRAARSTHPMELAPIPKRQKGSRSNRYVEPTTDDARDTVLRARCRQMGIRATEANLLAMGADMMGDPAGKAISIGARSTTEASALWGTFREVDAADDRHMRRIIGKPRFANVSRLEMLPDRFETRPDDRVDVRTDDEKDRAAKSAWAGWVRRFDGLLMTERNALQDGLRLRVPLTERGKLTLAGERFVRAVRVLHGQGGM